MKRYIGKIKNLQNKKLLNSIYKNEGDFIHAAIQNGTLLKHTDSNFKLERSISPLRRNSGKLIILDGRANKRNWGRLLLQNIQPSKQINYMLPFD